MNLIGWCTITCMLYVWMQVCVHECVWSPVLPWHKSLELSRGLVLLPPSVSVCRGEVFYTDDRVNGRRQEKVSHARVMWDGQRNKCCDRKGHQQHENTVRDFSLWFARFSLSAMNLCEIDSVKRRIAAPLTFLHAVLSLLHLSRQMNGCIWRLKVKICTS